MARAGRELTIAHGAYFAAQRLHGDRDAELLEDPLHEIDQSPAHDPVDRGDRAALDQLGERRPVRGVQYWLLARRRRRRSPPPSPGSPHHKSTPVPEDGVSGPHLWNP